MAPICWANTHGEQFHSKLILVKRTGKAVMFTGSANPTRQNIGNFNLETDVVVTGPRALPAIHAAEEYFDQLWVNKIRDCSAANETQDEFSTWRYWLYRFQQRTGASTF